MQLNCVILPLLTSSKRQGLLYHNRPCSFTTVALVEFRATRGKFDKFENYKLGKHLIIQKVRSWEKLEVGKTSNNNEEFKKLENLEN